MGCRNCKYNITCRDAFYERCNLCNNYDNEIDPVAFEMTRRVNQIVWGYYMKDNYYGREPFENDTFKIRPYSWADYEENDEDPNAWHFWHKPSGVRIEWYKYPLRGVRTNRKMTSEQFADILADCHNSAQTGGIKFLYGVTKWWEGEQ